MQSDENLESDQRFSKYLDLTEKSKRNRLLWRLFVIGLIFAVNLVLYLELSKYRAGLNQSAQTQVSAKHQVPTTQECDAETPTDKTYYILDQNILISPERLHSELDLINHYRFHVLMQINSTDHQTPLMLISLLPNSQMKISLPVGTYGAQLKVGNTWCNKQIGFSDGETILVSSPLEILPAATQRIKIDSNGPSMRDIRLSLKRLTQDEIMQVSSHGSTELLQQRDGQYFINGEINKFPMNFLIDTGAGYTSIPSNVADNLVIRKCKSQTFYTANGSTSGCIGYVSELRFGNFIIENVEVAVMPNLHKPVLGMNILSHIRMDSSQGLMRLTKN